jgi:hypothetical protein
MEQWKDISGYEGRYRINEFGQVLTISKKFPNGQYKKATKDKDGYLCVDLYKNGKRKHCKVHRLVAQEFIPMEKGKNIVNHKDENKQNNFVENLEWCDVRYNNTYNDRQKRINAQKRKPVCAISKDGTKVRFDSISEASFVAGTTRRNILYALKKEQNTAAGYRWEYCR